MYKEVAAAIHRRQITGGRDLKERHQGAHQMFFREVFGNHVIWHSCMNSERSRG